ncbi:phosphatidylinositol alpha-mannosyltransferase [Rhodococcus opacus PD630]|uniref:glycosyltransferase family 4 protein n=1 Tax=Rhodococcus opacus TaxID=37919 RepID=UPI00029CCC23|nr:glycosyltransferase family 4 protein [Rhodococcus opacus]AHK30721.1 GDP-mannose-dependent alpha-(1-2)-phosphatidylinositol mannosyltransferase [Rhodococcus opacus PD630]EHI47028.1 phosphatidylinositol alpha-mannosyltransferase [Rhodococcus opacus PD630]UDH00323.1 glycosyltransferase family 4 protein [Rhodococcus opacus PD630]
MKIGMVCPYSFDVPGGVQAHVVDLAEVLIERGHKVSVLAPASDDVDLPDFVVSAGRALAIPYNGSVARLSFGPAASARVRRWISDNNFDVLHIHEPNAPSLSMLAMRVAEGPIVATFHTSTTKSLVLSTFQGVLQPYLEKISGRIAVSELARRWQVESLGSDAVEIPNGVDVSAFANAEPLPGYPRRGRTILFLGRYDEPRKGMAVLLKALPTLVEKYPDLEVLVVGRGDEDKLRREAGPVFGHLRLLGQVDDAEKASALQSADVYCAPNLGGESFGIVLVEAMAAGAAVVASELDAFRRVLRDGQAGVLVPVGDAAALAAGIDSVLGDPERSAALTDFSRTVVTEYDWPVVAEQILRVYETVTVGRDGVREVGS